ncbi:hypothetical protein TNCV_1711691 [Trichonephila clavipes]|nr:hypothetical protein TNCV_1711691 [Trichonephila clavipes]
MCRGVFFNEPSTNSACVEVGTTHKHLRRGVNEQFQLYYLRRGEISGINVFIGYIVRASTKGARKKKSPGSGNEGKREIALNRRPELYRGKYRCVQPKINLLKRRSYACETQCFPVEPSGYRRGAFT